MPNKIKLKISADKSKVCPHKIQSLVQLHYMINAVIKLQYYPEALKVANIIPIHKTGKNKKEIESYRPITLLNGIAKILDNVLLKRLNTHELNNPIIPEKQFGFKAGYSTIAQIIRITHHATKAFNEQKQTVLVALDGVKAFDTV